MHAFGEACDEAVMHIAEAFGEGMRAVSVSPSNSETKTRVAWRDTTATCAPPSASVTPGGGGREDVIASCSMAGPVPATHQHVLTDGLPGQARQWRGEIWHCVDLGNHRRRRPPGALFDFGERTRERDQVGQCGLRLHAVLLRIGLVALDIDAECRARGACA